MAKVTSFALPIAFKRTTFSLSKIGNGGELRFYRTSGIISTVDGIESKLSGVFIKELDVGISRKMVGQVLANIQFVNGTMLGKFIIDIPIEVFKMVYDVLLRNGRRWQTLFGSKRDELVWRNVEVMQKQGWAEQGLMMDARAAITVPARANLEVEWTVDFVLLCAIDGSEMLRHTDAGQE